MNRLSIIFFSFICCTIFIMVFSKSRPCNSRRYDEDSVVCVCNLTYCDSIGKVVLPKNGKFISFTSSRDGYRYFKSSDHFEKTAKHDYLVTINANTTNQVIYGWGGAFTDSTGFNLLSLPVKLRQTLLRSYFTEEGNEYNILRIPIGGSDFSPRFYTYAEVPQDSHLLHFHLAPEDYRFKIPFIKQILKLSKETVKLIGSAWCSPVWMKTNRKSYGHGFLNEEYYQTWADYHIKFLDAYARHNISFWAITTGNEPTVAFLSDFKLPSVGWIPWDEARWIDQYFGPTIRNSKYFQTQILAFDDQLSFTYTWAFLGGLFGYGFNYVDGFATHWYFNKIIPTQLPLLHASFPNKFILSTEASVGSTFSKHVALGDWGRAELYLDDIIESMNNWVSGWLEWNLALDLEGGPSYIGNNVDSSIIVNASAQEFYKQTMYYALGHFSKFLPPKSVKIGLEVNHINEMVLKMTAFRRPDNGTVIIIFNKYDENVRLSIWDPPRGYINKLFYNRSVTTILYQ